MRELADLLSDLLASGLEQKLLIEIMQRLTHQEAEIDILDARRMHERERKRDNRLKHKTVTNVTLSRDVLDIPDITGQAEKHHNGTAQQTSMIAVEESKKESKKALRGRLRGSRINEGWEIPGAWLQWAMQKGVSEQCARGQAERFKNFWIATPGEKGVKCDWERTWQNWIMSHMERTGIGPKLSGQLELSPAKPSAGVWIKQDTPEWEAWRKHRGGAAFPVDKAGGWWAPAQWPNGH